MMGFHSPATHGGNASNAHADMTASLPDRASLWLALALAALCEAAALELGRHYPLMPPLAMALVIASTAIAALSWTRTPLLLALVPLIGFAPWTGWITFEETDMLVLACAAGGYAALALSLPPRDRAPAWRHALGFSPLAQLLMLLFAGSLLLSMQRGFADAGGFVFGWFQGYHEAMNSVRLTKSFFLVLLLLPLWVQAAAMRPREFTRALLLGMVLALAGICAACVWERQANTGLLNFSTDYRTTGLFWEMHVGGAALDGSLALTIPFAVLALLRARSPRRFVAFLMLALLAAYACLTTFSRGVFLAIPVGLAVLVQLRGAQRRRVTKIAQGSIAPLMSLPPLGKFGGLLLMASFVVAAALMFDSSGYRGELAVLGVMLALLAMPASQWLLSPVQRLMAVLVGALAAVVLAALCWAVSVAVPKAAYLEYVLAFVVAAVLRWKDRPGEVRPLYACLVSGSWYWLLACTVIVADNWGGAPASDKAMPCALGMAVLWPVMLMWPRLWPFKAEGIPGWRSRGLVFTGLMLAAAVVGALDGGAYIRERMSTAPEDMQVRLDHWKQGVSMLETPQDWLFGKGAGRFVANHFFVGPIVEHTGDYRLKKTEAGSPYLVLTGGMHMLGFGELFRVSQRIAPPQGRVLLKARVRAESDASLYAEICEKHLLYADNCLMANADLKAGKDWQDVSLDLGPARPMGGPWFAPRFVVFSVAAGNSGGVLDIASLNLGDGRSGALLANPDFSREMARWFFSSDRYHLPWHIKNLGLHVLFDQGLVGAALLGALLLLALWRMALGSGRDHPMAPAVAASLVGFLAVGAFDSLIDAPRIAFLFYTVLGMALGLRALPGAVTEPAR